MARAAFGIAKKIIHQIEWNDVISDDLAALPLASQVFAEFGATEEARRLCIIAQSRKGKIARRLAMAHDCRFEAMIEEAVALAYVERMRSNAARYGIRRARQHGLPVFIVEQRKANDERYQDFLHGVGEFFGDRHKRSDTSGDPTTKGRRPDPCDHFHQGKPGAPCTRILADGKPCGFSVAEHYGMRTPPSR